MLTVRLHNPDSSLPGKLGAPGSNASASGGQKGAATDNKDKPKTTQNYLPSGMFGQAIVLSGLDAPTGGQAQSNPHPVLLQLRDLAILPNRYRYDWKSCTVTGAGYGDISSERAYIRTESLSCVSKDGRVLDVPLKGYIAGEDGKAGMRGRLVSKQGQALANGLLAGVVSGIGSGLEKSSTVVSTSPLGTIATPKPGAEYQAGIGQGVGRSLDRLSNYYIQLAEKMFPIIEVDAGRVVDVVLTKGVYVDIDLQQE
jgi:conjugal transfer pilus assembly protein TraB